MRSNWQYLLLAFALAVFSWYLVSGREKVDTWIQVPVEMVNMPEGYVVRQGMVNRIDVRVRGPRPMVRTIDMRNAFYPLDLAGLQVGMNQLDFENRNLNLSRAIEVVEIVPSRVDLLVDQIITKRVPVQKQLEVELHEDFELRAYAVNPAEVTLRGPRVMVEPVDEVQTQPVLVEDDRPGRMERSTSLVLPPEVESSPSRVTLQLDFGEKLTEIDLEVRVTALRPTGMEMQLEPSTVQLTVQVPVSLAREADFAERVRIVAAHLGELPSGTHEVGYRVELPVGVMLLRAEPERIQVTLEVEVVDPAGDSPGNAG
ncbi:CdaR family protein [Desulfonatronum thioautotrophicum]|uniref:CdaR family protein n=1 Tax=Desulfonatronum thioautotrophicum TaxID=617001 RepID=UPI0005EAEB61|nr:CdaR family protein [Desulfonatronum thioautotrophicum]